jgi:hypothetical protein
MGSKSQVEIKFEIFINGLQGKACSKALLKISTTIQMLFI